MRVWKRYKRLGARSVCPHELTLILVPPHRRWGTFREEEERLQLSERNSILMTQNLSGIRSEALIGRRSSFIVLAIVYEWQTKDGKGQMKTRRICNKTVDMWGIQSSPEEAFEFCRSSFADEHNAFPKLTRRNVKLNKFAFGIPWLPDLLCKHWFTSSLWNFCRWVADVPPRETSLSGDERGETSAVRRLRPQSLLGTWARGPGGPGPRAQAPRRLCGREWLTLCHVDSLCVCKTVICCHVL